MFHDFAKDGRRKLGTFKSEKCPCLMPADRKNVKPCPDGDACQYAHNIVEEFYHPEKYKAKFC